MKFLYQYQGKVIWTNTHHFKLPSEDIWSRRIHLFPKFGCNWCFIALCLHIHFPRSEPRLSLCFFQLFFKCIVSLQSHLTFQPYKDKNANYSTNTAATLKTAQRGGTASSSFSYQTALAVTFALEAAVVPVWATKNSHLKTQHLTEQNKQTNHLLLPPKQERFPTRAAEKLKFRYSTQILLPFTLWPFLHSREVMESERVRFLPSLLCCPQKPALLYLVFNGLSTAGERRWPHPWHSKSPRQIFFFFLSALDKKCRKNHWE